MNKIFLTLGLAALFVFGSAALNSCDYSEKAEHEQHDDDGHDHSEADGHEHDDDSEHVHAAVFQCPMQCEGDKTYEKAGACPECGMDLEEISTDEHDGEKAHSEEIPHDHDGDGQPDHD